MPLVFFIINSEAYGRLNLIDKSPLDPQITHCFLFAAGPVHHDNGEPRIGLRPRVSERGLLHVLGLKASVHEGARADHRRGPSGPEEEAAGDIRLCDELHRPR
eukprot:1501776-Pyramimonas_sp.AAC.1